VHGNDILDFKKWWSHYYKLNPISVETRGKNFKKEQKLKFGISSFHQFRYSSAIPGVIVAYLFIDSLIKHTFDMHKSVINNNLHFPPTKMVYPLGVVPLKHSKVDDVLKLQPYIPQKYIPFINKLINWSTTINTPDDYD